jgi:hypothetical protein
MRDRRYKENLTSVQASFVPTRATLVVYCRAMQSIRCLDPAGSFCLRMVRIGLYNWIEREAVPVSN